MKQRKISNRVALLIEPRYSLPTQKVPRLVDQMASKKGYPREIRVDNGPEFAAIAFKKWAALHKVQINYIQPGKPAQNGFTEHFNGSPIFAVERNALK